MWLQDLHIYTWGLPGGNRWRSKMEYRLPGLVGKLSETADTDRPGDGVAILIGYAKELSDWLQSGTVTLVDAISWVHDHQAHIVGEGDF